MNCGFSTNLLPRSRAGSSGIRLHSRLSTVERASSAMELSGGKFGKWTVIMKAAPMRWLCACDCGTVRVVSQRNLRMGLTNSCGCARIGKPRTHGKTNTPEHRTWMHMRGRCENPNNKDYPDYGGRGIRVCDKWNISFQAFLDDMGPRPDKHEIDRIDTNGDYKPGNCRWADRFTQMQNTRLTRSLTLNGVTMCLSQWARHLNISTATLSERLSKWSIERALTEQKHGKESQ